MKLNKQLIKKINSPRILLVFIALLIFVIVIIHLLFNLIRTIFDMDKQGEQKLNIAQKNAQNSNNKTNTTGTTGTNKTNN